MDALSHERLDAMLDAVLPAAMCETGRDPPGQAEDAINLPQEQRACIRRDGAAVEGRRDFPAYEAGEIEGIQITLCLHRGHPLLQLKPLLQKNFR
jgi:hypothetical protein